MKLPFTIFSSTLFGSPVKNARGGSGRGPGTRVWGACAALLLALPFLANAHDLNSSYTTLTIQGDHLQVVLRIDQTDLLKVWDLDENEDGAVSNDEILLYLDELHDAFQEAVRVVVAGDTLALTPASANIVEDELGNAFVDLAYDAVLRERPWRVTLAAVRLFSDFGPQHKNLAKIVYEGEVQQSIFTVADPVQSFTFEGGSVSLLEQVRQFVWLGMEHIFIGYDHILFLIGLIAVGGTFLNLVKIVSAFTVAHSITLILAALQVVMVPSRVVESVIALSIVYIAVENFLIKDSDQRWMVTFAFGLMHGFGFAGVLTELGLPTKGLVASLLSFNVGVEIGQVMIVSLVFPVILLASRTRWQRQIVYGLSSVILTFGLIWFFQRAFGLEIFPI